MQYIYAPIKAKDGVIESEVLEGFSFRDGDLYTRPTEEELIKDSVYKHYVSLAYQY